MNKAYRDYDRRKKHFLMPPLSIQSRITCISHKPTVEMTYSTSHESHMQTPQKASMHWLHLHLSPSFLRSSWLQLSPDFLLWPPVPALHCSAGASPPKTLQQLYRPNYELLRRQEESQRCYIVFKEHCGHFMAGLHLSHTFLHPSKIYLHYHSLTQING